MNKILRKERTAAKDSFLLYASTEQGNKIACFLVDWIILWLFLVGITGWLIAVCDLPINNLIFLAGQAMVAFVTQFVVFGTKKERYIKGIICGILVVIVFMIAKEWILNGIHIICNYAVDVLGERMPYIFPHYQVDVAEKLISKTLYGTMFYLSFFFAILGSYIIAIGNRFLLSILFLVVVVIEITTGISAGFVWSLILCLCFFAAWLKGHVEQIADGKQKIAVLENFVFTAALGFVIVLVTGVVFQKVGFKELTLFSFVKEQLYQTVEEYRYAGESDILPEGQFSGLESFEPAKTNVLQVTMSKPESYYLRGFTGENYTGTGWEKTDSATLWENRDLFYWLHDDGFYGQEILGNAALALDAKVSEEEKNTIHIKNLTGSSKYYYVPYELQSEENSNTRKSLNGQMIGDSGLLAEGFTGQREYAYKALSNQITKYPVYATALLKEDKLTDQGKQYKKLEEYYNEFVYKAYMDIPGNIQVTLAELLGEKVIEEGEKHADYAEAKENILYVLTTGYEEEKKLEKPWDGKDFIFEFLGFSKKGYSVHFASTAAMMFRYYGIPARYVEGYLVTPKDVEQMSPGEPYMIDESHAHAWVEYYQDGVGWLPFEITPSYLNTMSKAEDYQDISGAGGSGTKKEEKKKQLEDEKEDDEKQEDEIDWLSIIIVVLLVSIALMLLCILGFFIWVIYKRMQSKKIKKLFLHEDPRVAVKALFEYSMNILSVSGLYISNASLFSYANEVEEMFDEELAKEYYDVVEIRQEAVYSQNTMIDEQKTKVEAFKNEVWNRIYVKGNVVQKFQLKYIYFL